MHDCSVCSVVPKLLGKKFMMPLLGHHYSKISFNEIQNHLGDLDLEIVGGLKKRGWTTNDIDVVGSKTDIAVFSKRLQHSDVKNPVHYCGERSKHSHVQCAYYGVKLALTGRGY